MEFLNTKIAKYVPIHAMIRNYEAAREEVKQAFEYLKRAEIKLKSIYNEDLSSYRSAVLGRDRINLDSCLLEMKRSLWREIVTKAQLGNFLSENRRKELDKTLHPDDYAPDALPEITLENVQSFISNIAGDLQGLFKESVCEVFDMLRPRRSEHKTNTEFEVGERVILNWIVNCDKWGFVSVCRGEQKLINLDNVFHLLDGNGISKYPGDLLTAIRCAIAEKRWSVETKYFSCKWHKKGTLHVRFKRLDLVAQLNRIAGGSRLKK